MDLETLDPQFGALAKQVRAVGERGRERVRRCEGYEPGSRGRQAAVEQLVVAAGLGGRCVRGSAWTPCSVGAGHMATDPPVRGRAAELRGRRGERGALDLLIEAVRAGESRALVVAGEPGVGKTALLDYLAGNATGCHVVRTAGIQSEME